ncbi:MAG: hypothetical protein ACLVEJ_00695 [Parabacteroides sp.]
MLMRLGHKGGFRPDSVINWQWRCSNRNIRDKIWMEIEECRVMNFCFKDENYVLPAGEYLCWFRVNWTCLLRGECQ